MTFSCECGILFAMEMRLTKLVRPEMLAVQAVKAVPAESENPTIGELIANVEKDVTFNKTKDWAIMADMYLDQRPQICKLCFELQTEEEYKTGAKIAAVRELSQTLVDSEEKAAAQFDKDCDCDGDDTPAEGTFTEHKTQITLSNDKGESISCFIEDILVTPQILKNFMELANRVPATDKAHKAASIDACKAAQMAFIQQNPEFDDFLYGFINIDANVAPEIVDIMQHRDFALVNDYTTRAVEDVARRAADKYDMAIKQLTKKTTRTHGRPAKSAEVDSKLV